MIDGFDWLWAPFRALVVTWISFVAVVVGMVVPEIAAEARLWVIARVVIVASLVLAWQLLYVVAARSYFAIADDALIVHRRGKTERYPRADIHGLRFSFNKTGAAICISVDGLFFGVRRPVSRFLPGLVFCRFAEGRDIATAVERWRVTSRVPSREDVPNSLRDVSVLRPRGRVVVAVCGLLALGSGGVSVAVWAGGPNIWPLTVVAYLAFIGAGALSWRVGRAMWWLVPDSVGVRGVVRDKTVALDTAHSSCVSILGAQRLCVCTQERRLGRYSLVYAAARRSDREAFLLALTGATSAARK